MYLPIGPSGWSPRRPHSQGRFYLTHLGTSPVWKAILGVLGRRDVSKTIRSSYLRLQLSEIVDAWANNRLSRIFKRKSWGMRVFRGFENLHHIPGDLQGHVCVRGYTCAEEGSKKALGSDLRLTWRLCESSKWRPRLNCKLGECWRRATMCTREPLS